MSLSQRLYHAILDIVANHAQHLGTTSNTELHKLGKNFLGEDFRGVFASDKIPRNNGYYIINLDKSHMPGSHWVGLVIKDGKKYVYDSFARKNLLPMRGAIYVNEHPDQLELAANCGQRSLAWLILASKWGMSYAKHV